MSRALRIALGVLAVLLVLGLGFFGYWLDFPNEQAPTGLSGTFIHYPIETGGRTRTYGLYVPAGLPKNPPLIIVLHGSDESGDAVRWRSFYGFDHVGDRLGFVIAYPDGFMRYWNDCRNADYPARAQHIDDVGFLRALVAQLHTTQSIDPARVFVTGFSNGGQMALRVALEAPDLIRAAAPISASLPTPDNMDCTPAAKPVSILFMNGTEDPINPYGGGRMTPFAGGRVTLFGLVDRGTVLPAVDSVREFVRRSGLRDTPSVERLPGSDQTLWVDRSTWGDPHGIEVVLDAIHGGGHAIPQAGIRYPRILGRTDAAFDGPAEIGRFFSQFR